MTESRPYRAPLWLLGLITFSGTMAMHIFIPALPAVALDLGANIGAVQLTISFYIAGLALGQLVIGPLSDRYGRRPVLMAGLVLYSIAGFAAALAPTIEALIVARLIQAFGGCAGLVLGRAIVRDGTAPSEAARRLALMNLITVIGPGAAPIIGAAISDYLGWRSIFYALCAFGCANLILTILMLKETAALSKDVSARTVMRGYTRLLRTPVFVAYAVGGGCATTSMYAFIGAAPFIFINELHRPTQEVGIYLALILFGAWLGSLAASRLTRAGRLDRMMVQGNLISIAAAIVLLVTVISGHLSVVMAVVPMMVFSFGCVVASPAAMTRAISVNPEVAGSASGVYGFAQMAVGAICTALVSLGRDPALAAGIVLVGTSMIGQLFFWYAISASRKT